MINELAEQLSNIRIKKAEFSKQLEQLKEREDEIKQTILEYLAHIGVKSVTTEKFLIITTENEVPVIDDWDIFWEYVQSENKSYLIQKRPSATAVKELATIQGGVPGIKFVTVKNLGLRTK